MRASKFSAPGAPLTVEECPVPALDASEVLVRVMAALGSFGSTLHDLEQVIEFVSSGQLDLSGSITARLPLSGVNDALRILEDPVGDHVRIVIVPSEKE